MKINKMHVPEHMVMKYNFVHFEQNNRKKDNRREGAWGEVNLRKMLIEVTIHATNPVFLYG